MAQRFGGKFSPQHPNMPGETAVSLTAAPHRFMRRNRVFFLVALLFPLQAFNSAPQTLLAAIFACAILLVAAWINQEGLRAEAAYDARTLSRRHAIPRKLFAAVLNGVAVAIGIAAWQPLGQDGWALAVLFGLTTAVLHLCAFGLDPMKNKGLEGIDAFQTDRVARAVEEAEAYLAEMKGAILRANDRNLEARVDGFIAVARGLFRIIEGDPGDLTAARKFLSVYLMGARNATIKFADHFAQTRDPAVRAQYEALLTDLETNFAERSKALMSNSQINLDVEIQVLRERLTMEN
jgi:hypothetical protein